MITIRPNTDSADHSSHTALGARDGPAAGGIGIRLSRLLVVLVFLAAPVAACGKSSGGPDDGVASVDRASDDSGSSDDDSGSGGDGDRPSNQEFEDAALEYTQCMRDHGVDMPDPEFDGEGNGGGMTMMLPEGADRDTVEAAEEECHPIMDEVAPDADEIDPEEQAEMQDQLLEVAQCMREKGHDMPDPEVDDNGRVTFGAAPGERGEGIEPDDEFQQDMEDCQEQAGMDLPQRRSESDGGGGGVATGGGGDA
jgi:hypothetical protein